MAAAATAAALAFPLLVAGSAHYQMSLSGIPVGRVALSLAASSDGWTLTYQSQAWIRRGPAVAMAGARASAELSASGELRSLSGERAEGGAALVSVVARTEGGELAVEVRPADGAARTLRMPRAFASSIAPFLLSPERPCLPVVEETSGRAGLACAEAFGEELTGTLLGEPFRARVRGARLERLEFPEQSAVFARVDREPAPPRAQDLFGGSLAGAGPAPTGGAAAWALRAEVALALPVSASQAVERSEDRAIVRWRRIAPELVEPLAALPQVDRDELGAAARQSIRAARDVWSTAAALARLVDERVEVKLPADAEGSPQRVWQERRAGCRGHVALFLALASRAGIGARRAIGLVAQEERFYWHAWAQVRVGARWYDVDPTEGEAPPSAARILFAAGDGEVEWTASRLLGLARGLRIERLPLK